MASATQAAVPLATVAVEYLEGLVRERDRWKGLANQLETTIRNDQEQRRRRHFLKRTKPPQFSPRTRADVVALLEYLASKSDGRLMADCLLAADLVAKGT